ncbi:Riboflavin transporter RibZ [Candidatus Entotheonellaceae bacterium PAL068K]
MLTPPARYRRWLTLASISLGAAIGPLDSAVNIAFPAISAAFNLPLAAIQWVIICYVLTYASLLLGSGRLGDIVGHRRVFVLGLSGSVMSFLLCGLAPTFGWFLLFRGLQGIATALVLSCGPALATLAFPEAQRGKILGLYNMLFAMAYALGPLAGGLLIARWGWSAVFYFRAPLALLSVLLMLRLGPQVTLVKAGQRFDMAGAVALSLALASFLLAFNRAQHLGWFSGTSLLLFGLTGGSLTFLIWHEARCAEPVIDLGLFRWPAFATANMAHILAHVASFTILLVVPYYLLDYYRVSATVGGFLLAMSPLGAVVASPLGGWLLSRHVARHLCICGLLLIAAGLGGISLWPQDAAVFLIATTLAVQGCGLGLFQVANMDFVMGAVPRTYQGVAGSLTVLTRTIGVVGCATVATLALDLLQSHYTMRLHAAAMPPAEAQAQAFVLAFQWLFRGAAAIALIAVGLMWSSRLASTPARADAA